MEDEIAASMSKKTTEELVKILTVDKLNYSPIGLKIAEGELISRNESAAFIEEIKTRIQGEHYKNLQQETELSLQTYAKELFSQKKKRHEVKHIFTMGGLEAPKINHILHLIEEELHLKKKELAEKDMQYGALWFVGGLVASIADIGRIFYGAIGYGAYLFFKGLNDYYAWRKIEKNKERNTSIDSLI